MRELRLIGGYAKSRWLHYAAGILALAAVDLMNVYIPQFTGQITDGLKAGTIGMDGVWRLIGLIILMGAAMAASGGATSSSARPWTCAGGSRRTCSPTWRGCPCATTTSTRPVISWPISPTI